jgi:hypothetical protein
MELVLSPQEICAASYKQWIVNFGQNTTEDVALYPTSRELMTQSMAITSFNWIQRFRNVMSETERRQYILGKCGDVPLDVLQEILSHCRNLNNPALSRQWNLYETSFFLCDPEQQGEIQRVLIDLLGPTTNADTEVGTEDYMMLRQEVERLRREEKELIQQIEERIRRRKGVDARANIIVGRFVDHDFMARVQHSGETLHELIEILQTLLY